MKHFRKVCAVLLAVLMVAVILPTTGLLESIGTPSVDAADPGVLVNGGFESGYTSTPHSSGNGSYNKCNEGWTQNEWATSIQTSTKQSGSYAAKITGHNSVKNATALEQIIPVNTNATYTLTFYVKGRSYKDSSCATVYTVGFNYSVHVGNESGSCTTALYDNQSPSVSSTSWTKVSVNVATGDNKYLRLRFIAWGDDNGDSYLDSVSLSVVNAGNTGTHAKPTLTAFATDKNRPASSSDNIIVQPGFESTTNAQWNTTNFVGKNGVSLVTGDSAGAHSGSAYLKYYRGNVGYDEWPKFEVTCPTAGEYVFSAWVRTPNLGTEGNVKAQASIGVLDRDTGKFLTYSKLDSDNKEAYYGHYSTPEIQIRSTATDNQWHLRSVTFYVGAANSNIEIGMYGLASTMYVDDISVHLLSKGVTYSGDQKGTLSASKSSTNYYCESEDNLIPDCNMNGSVAEDFWSGASGWNNGFLEFNKDATSNAHGKVLHYKTTNPASNKKYRYVKFVSVEPNTSYTVSFDYRIVTAGNNLMFFDNNIEKNAVFHTPSLGSASNSWKTYTFTFNSGNYNRIGIVFQDGYGEAYYDDFRFFKTDDKTTSEPAEEVFPTLKHNKGENNPVLESRMEVENKGLGLAFLFNLEATGVTRNAKFEANYTNGKVDAFETGELYTLVKAGAVVTNKEEVGQDEKAFTLDNVKSDNTVIDVNAKYLFYNPVDENGSDKGVIHYAIRITNIPEDHKGTTIYVRPYYVFKYGDQEVTVYGDVVYDAYEQIPDINDGWLEWD